MSRTEPKKKFKELSVNSGTKVTQPETRHVRRQFRDCPGHSGTVGNPIATIYRHPSQATDKFVEDFSNCLEKLTYEKKTFYILGDININIYGNNLSVQAKNYINAIECDGAYSIITQPTRITAHSATLIDHVITNDVAHNISPLLLPQILVF